MGISRKRIEEMAQEIRNKAQENGYEVDLEEVNDATSKNEAYVLGRYEQLSSILDEMDEDES